MVSERKLTSSNTFAKVASASGRSPNGSSCFSSGCWVLLPELVLAPVNMLEKLLKKLELASGSVLVRSEYAREARRASYSRLRAGSDST